MNWNRPSLAAIRIQIKLVGFSRGPAEQINGETADDPVSKRLQKPLTDKEKELQRIQNF
ncbi:MAG TPA: hypothetical protein IAB57_06865 [Candidatus Fimivivens faecavium]|nr:hypothetical protein [Candidatus Fimivivens faecavium]